jgi:hypothetical protein
MDAAFAQDDAELALHEGIADEGPFFESGRGGEVGHGSLISRTIREGKRSK